MWNCVASSGKEVAFLRRHGIKEPQPLRSDEFPDGFSQLAGPDKLRTELANLLYEHTVEIAQAAIELGVAVCIENPSNSIMWKTSPFVRLFQHFPQLKSIHFHNCAHGGSRDKKTCFVTNVSWFDSLQVFCNKQHKHAPWTPTVTGGQVVYPTHSEAAYPALLCERIASLVKCEMLRQGAIEPADMQQHVQSSGKSLNRILAWEHSHAENMSNRWFLNLEPMFMQLSMHKMM